MLIAERVPSPVVRNGMDAIGFMKQTMAGTNMTVEFLDDPHVEKLDGAQFGVVTVKLTSSFGAVQEKVYMLVRGEYIVEFFYTYFDDADLPAFTNIMKSVKLK